MLQCSISPPTGVDLSLHGLFGTDVSLIVSVSYLLSIGNSVRSDRQ